MTYDPRMALPVSAFPLSILPEAPPSINCFQALDYLCVLLNQKLLDWWAHWRIIFFLYTKKPNRKSPPFINQSNTRSTRWCDRLDNTWRWIVFSRGFTPFLILFLYFSVDIIEVNPVPLNFIQLSAELINTTFLQEMISEEIIDETDQYEDNHSKRLARRHTTASVLGGCVLAL